MVLLLLCATTAPPWPPCQPQPRGSGAACCWQSVCLSVCLPLAAPGCSAVGPEGAPHHGTERPFWCSCC